MIFIQNKKKENHGISVRWDNVTNRENLSYFFVVSTKLRKKLFKIVSGINANISRGLKNDAF